MKLLLFIYFSGSESTPSSFSGRIVFLSIFVTTFLTFSYYSAYLISSLATKTLVLPFNSFEVSFHLYIGWRYLKYRRVLRIFFFIKMF